MVSVPTEFTPLTSLGGGALIGLSTVLVMLFFGRIAGISGITLQAMRPLAEANRSDWGWRAAFIMGLLTASALVSLVTGRAALTSLTLAAPGTLVFVPAMLVGMWIGFRARNAGFQSLSRKETIS